MVSVALAAVERAIKMQEVIVRALGGELALRLYRERCEGNPSSRAHRSLTTLPSTTAAAVRSPRTGRAARGR
jgi:hypothetical protein